MELLIQPGAGSNRLLSGINSATKSIELVIFRFDRRELESALETAVGRGVFVHALIAYTNRGGEKNLRKLEMRLLGAGVTVARSADDLDRYHDKFMIIDRRRLFLQTFNHTHLDINSSRSFGIITEESSLVDEAVRLFEADTTRQPYTAQLDTFLVSPVNAREKLADFIERAQQQLWIYDPKISDDQMKTLLEERAKAGVDIRIVGHIGKNSVNLMGHQLPNMRLHTRAMIRDRREAFIGSQSLREAELDSRREVGIIIHEPDIVNSLLTTFESDWKAIEAEIHQSAVNAEAKLPVAKAVEEALKTIAKDPPSLDSVVKEAMKETEGGGGGGAITVDSKRVEKKVKEAVKGAIKEVVVDVIEEP